VRKAPWTTVELRTLREHRAEHAVSIAARLGRTPGAVAEMARRHGIELAPRPGHAAPERVRRRALVLRGDGVPVREIARRIGASRSAVSNWTRHSQDLSRHAP